MEAIVKNIRTIQGKNIVIFPIYFTHTCPLKLRVIFGNLVFGIFAYDSLLIQCSFYVTDT